AGIVDDVAGKGRCATVIDDSDANAGRKDAAAVRDGADGRRVRDVEADAGGPEALNRAGGIVGDIAGKGYGIRVNAGAATETFDRSRVRDVADEGIDLRRKADLDAGGN